MSWTEEQKASLIKEYVASNPTPENSIEICKALAEKFNQSPNGVRVILTKAEVYVKKAATSTPASGETKPAGEGAKRVSKESQINALIATIEGLGKPVDKDVIEKLTGKAAAYFDSLLK